MKRCQGLLLGSRLLGVPELQRGGVDFGDISS